MIRQKTKSGDVSNDFGIPLPFAWGSIVKDTLRIDNPSELAKRLRSELTLIRNSEDEKLSYSSILSAVDKSAKNYDDAYLLFRAAKIEERKFEIDTRERLEVLKSAAREELMKEYKNKERKLPTLEDIQDRMVSNWPSEYRYLTTKTSEMHAVTRSLETLSKAWASKCLDLRVMADMYTRRRKG